jgi:hypothetical protein
MVRRNRRGVSAMGIVYTIFVIVIIAAVIAVLMRRRR